MSDLQPVARVEPSRQKFDENVSKCIGLLYVRGVTAGGKDLLTVATAARRVFVEEGADLGDHRLGWVGFFPWPNRNHTDLPEIAEVYS